jgi:hypothetical protein
MRSFASDLDALPLAAPLAAVLLAAALLLSAPGTGAGCPAAPDALDVLAQAVAGFRGLGHPDVVAYRVPLSLPDEEDDEPVALEELWRADGDLVIRAADPRTPGALVRSLALYLEPLYVARSALIDLDLAAAVTRLRETATITVAEVDAGTQIEVRLAAGPDPELPEYFRDVTGLAARLDGAGRLVMFRLDLRGEAEPLRLSCRYGDASSASCQPTVASWTLPSGEPVEIRNTFRDVDGRALPAVREIVFPSRYDPAETERIEVRYGAYELNGPLAEELFAGPGAFRYDLNGLVSE